jgi:hypothetical protein
VHCYLSFGIGAVPGAPPPMRGEKPTRDDSSLVWHHHMSLKVHFEILPPLDRSFVGFVEDSSKLFCLECPGPLARWQEAQCLG